MNWLVHEHNGGRRTFALYEKYARDIIRDPYYMWMEKIRYASPIFFVGHAVIYLAVTAFAMVAVYGWGDEALRMTSSVFLWGVIARTVWVWHITWAVNSLTHLFGYRNFDTPDGSRNNWFVTLLTAGEGWHNNHHADQASATVQIRWWEFDLNYYVIQFLGKIGLATNIVPPRHIREANRKRQMQKHTAA
jgi:stearoyl-CoA desaturase (delta-9 desaturase)